MNRLMACLLVLSVLTACGPQPTFLTKRGAGVYFDEGVTVNWDKETADDMEDWAVAAFQARYGGTEDAFVECLITVDVEIQPGNDYYGAEDPGGDCGPWVWGDRCWGYYNGVSDNITLTQRACQGRYVYPHELMHVLGWCLYRFPDAGHVLPIWQDIAKVQDYFSAAYGCNG